MRGQLSKSSSLKVAVDVNRAILVATKASTPAEMYRDENQSVDTSNLSAVLSAIPMFADELPLVEQAMVDYGNEIKKSPIVHPEIAGRGIEYAHGRAAYFYGSRCNGKLAEMEALVRLSYSKKNIPQELSAKFERRTNDYQRCYRMGVLSKDLEKMRKEIKTHRNMLDYHYRFIHSTAADDETDTHTFNRKSLSKILPQKLIAFSTPVTSPIFPTRCR
jgi:hypothetical protein